MDHAMASPRAPTPGSTLSPAVQVDTAWTFEAELRQHVADCGWHLECAYARFQTHGDPADRDAAVMWLHQQQEAQRALQRHLDDVGVGFFTSDLAQGMGRPGWGRAS